MGLLPHRILLGRLPALRMSKMLEKRLHRLSLSPPQKPQLYFLRLFILALLFSRRPSSSHLVFCFNSSFIHLISYFLSSLILSHLTLHFISQGSHDSLEDELLATFAAISASPFNSSNLCQTPTELQMLVQRVQRRTARRRMAKSDQSLAAPASASARKRGRWFHMMTIPMEKGGRRLGRGIAVLLVQCVFRLPPCLCS